MIDVNLLALRRRVRSRLGVPVSDQFFTDDVLDDTINLAVETIETEHYWPWSERAITFTLTAGSDALPIVPDFRAMRAVYVDGIELNEIAQSDFFGLSATAQGHPSVWSEVARQPSTADPNVPNLRGSIAVRPFADADYDGVMIYYPLVVPLVNDADQTVIPGQYAGAIIAKACELLSIREDDRGAAGVHQGDYQQWLGRMRRNLRRSTQPVVPRVREGSWI